MAKQDIMKDMKLNDMVSVTLPAHVWLGFIAAYGSTGWSSEDTGAIFKEAVAQLFDPLYLKEREAAMQQHHDQIKAIMTGQPPEIPPHMEAPE